MSSSRPAQRVPGPRGVEPRSRRTVVYDRDPEVGEAERIWLQRAGKGRRLPLTERQVIELLTKWSPTASLVVKPVGFSPEGPLVTLKLKSVKMPALPLPTAESWNDGVAWAAPAMLGADSTAMSPRQASSDHRLALRRDPELMPQPPCSP